MAIKNYSTTIPAIRTAGEIEEILIEHDARNIQKNIEEKKIVGFSFLIDTPYGERLIRLPVNTQKALTVLRQNKKKNSGVKDTEEQAEKVAWRILKDWVDAQMALIEIEMVKMEEVFLPYTIIDNFGTTVYERLEQAQLMLP